MEKIFEKEKRVYYLTVPMTLSEKNSIQKKAIELGMTTSAYVRLMLIYNTK